MNASQFGKLVAFLERLDKARIRYAREHSRDDAIMVSVVAPGQYWEIEFIEDGTIDVERYESNGHIDDESVLEELFTRFSDEGAATSHDSRARATELGKGG